VDRASDSKGLLNHLFSVRTRSLAGEFTSYQSSSYLSGILIGHEVKMVKTDRPLFIVATRKLGDLYMRAFEYLGIEASLLNPDVAATGLYHLGRSIIERGR